MVSPKITVHQCLHGYADGHRLLRQSTPLPDDVLRTLLTMTDASGSTTPGFEICLTGYPLRTIGMYVFGKTWTAPEMPRPGCVWTHSLLIETGDLERLLSAQAVTHLLTYPSPEVSSSFYCEALQVDIPPCPSPVHLSEAEMSIAGLVLQMLYSDGDRPVLIVSDESSPLERVLLAVWEQQWPSLRAATSFCSGSISTRRIEGQPLDLQVVPTARVRQVVRDLPTAHVITPPWKMTDEPSWVRAAVRELDLTQPSDLRSCLWTLGASVGADRSAFSQIIDISQGLRSVLRGEGSLIDLISDIAGRFPAPSDGAALKTALFASAPSDLLGSCFAEKQVIECLAHTPHFQSFDAQALHLHERSQHLWTNDPTAAQDILLSLLSQEPTPFGKLIVHSLLAAMDLDHVFELDHRMPGVLFAAIRANPRLAVSHRIWRLEPDLQREVLAALPEEGQTEIGTFAEVVRTALDCATDVRGEEFVRKLGMVTVRAFLDWVEDQENIRPSRFLETWFGLIENYPSESLAWLAEQDAARPFTVLVIVGSIHPDTYDVQLLPLSILLQRLPSVSFQTADAIAIRAYARVFSLGMKAATLEAAGLVAMSFGIVHQAAALQVLDYTSWQVVENYVPSLSWFRNWDKCERLRRGLIGAFIGNDWPMDAFLLCGQREDIFRCLVRSCQEVKGGMAFARRLRSAVALQGVIGTDMQRRVLNQELG